MSNQKPLIVLAALPYSNGRPHVGHLAGAYLPSDTYVRFKRLQGHKVL
ncbi:MAG: class I tRNA ligase family protein, partial [Bdellovibrionales bacterium]|nr:class I tRNA ligase family protein [Bdellovibrionales bacterium]